jgi:hypothetical protein
LNVKSRSFQDDVKGNANDKADDSGKNRFFASLRMTVCACFLVIGVMANGQAPKISVLFPNGGKVGTTVEVELRGAALAGTEQLIVNTPHVVGEIDRSVSTADEKTRPLFQSKCGSCHELRSPANRSMTAAQWAATVDRMIRVRQAPISADESTQITKYLQDQARAGRVTGRLKIAPETPPGLYEVRAVTGRSISTAGLFEVGALPQVVSAAGKREDAQPITLPCIANGSLSGNAERHYFRFAAKKGDRLVFDFKAFRLDERTQTFFNPQIRLLDSAGKEVAENHGYFDLDPLIDWTCAADGDYTLEVCDMLGRGNPGSVYRLKMAALPADAPIVSQSERVARKAGPFPDGMALSAIVRPDEILIRPGTSTGVEVVVTRRDGIDGPLTVTAEDLPAGVTARPIVLPPDRQTARVILTASAEASPAVKPIRFLVKSEGRGAKAVAEAAPQEVYLYNNQQRFIDREQCVLAVRGERDLNPALEGDTVLRVHPKDPIRLKVKLNRKSGYRAPVLVLMAGLPNGWVATSETVPGDKDETTLTIRPDGGNQEPFIRRAESIGAWTAVVAVVADDLPFIVSEVTVVPAVKPADR